MKKLMTVIMASLFCAAPAMANDFAAVLGGRTNTWSITNAGGASTGGSTGYQGGVLAFVDLASQLQFRTGMMYTARNYTAGSPTSLDYDFTYFDIPLTLDYKFAEYAGVFAGGVVGLNVGKSVPVGFNGTANSTIYGFQLGASFKFASQLGAEIFYENISSNIYDFGGNSKGNAGTSVGVNLLITFE